MIKISEFKERAEKALVIKKVEVVPVVVGALGALARALMDDWTQLVLH